MSPITRAFTTRRVKMSLELAEEARNRAGMQRSNTTKAPTSHAHSSSKSNADGVQVYRPKISAPIELVHTTNMLSYNAPDLPRPSTSSQASTKSESDSESNASSPSTEASSPPTSPDVAPEELEDRACSPEPNHLSCYFVAPGQANSASTAQAPVIPRRAPSHTKKASFEALTRQRSASVLSKDSHRSISTKASFTFSRASSSSSTTTSTSHNSFQSFAYSKMPPSTAPEVPTVPAIEKQKQPERQHPFSHELAMVDEQMADSREKLDIIEEKPDATPSRVIVEDPELKDRGLTRFSAHIYEDMIGELERMIYGEDQSATTLRVPPVAVPIVAPIGDTAGWI